MKIFLLLDGNEQTGPFSKSEIFAELRKGICSMESFARLESDSEWIPLANILNNTGNSLFSIQKIHEIQADLPHSPLVPILPESIRPVKETTASANKIKWALPLILFLVSIAFLIYLKPPTESFVQSDQETEGPTQIRDLKTTSITSVESPVAIVDLEKKTDIKSLDSSKGVSALSPADPKPEAYTIGIEPTQQAQESNAAVTNRPAALPNTSFDAPKTIETAALEEKPTKDAESQIADGISSSDETQPVRQFVSLPEPSTSDFFRILSVKSVTKEPRDGSGAWLQEGSKRINWKTKVFVPYFELLVQTGEQYFSKDTFIKVHIFDSNKKLIQTLEEPAIAWRTRAQGYSVPPLYPKKKTESVYFPLPESFDPSTDIALAVFGDKQSATFRALPTATSTFAMDFPERSLIDKRDRSSIAREAAVNPVTETVVETYNKKQPLMTLFMRLPLGAKDGHQAKGVLALCLLANNPDQIRKTLQKMDREEDGRIYTDIQRAFKTLESRIDPEQSRVFQVRISNRRPEDDATLVEDMQNAFKNIRIPDDDKPLLECKNLLGQISGRIYTNNLVKFADRHQLAILAWGARRLWDPKLSYDEQSKKINREMDDTFDDVAKAWSKAVDKLSKEYGFPSDGFLLTGASGAAQYACRLALRQPERFLAIHAHIPSSFDHPTPKANQILWLLTTGEREGGYPAAKRFFNDCKSLGYPIIFKGIPGLGHSGSIAADKLGMIFFEYALSVGEERKALNRLNRSNTASSIGPLEPWPKSFKDPTAIGDILNQETVTFSEKDTVATELRVTLPSPDITSAWSR